MPALSAKVAVSTNTNIFGTLSCLNSFELLIGEKLITQYRIKIPPVEYPRWPQLFLERAKKKIILFLAVL